MKLFFIITTALQLLLYLPVNAQNRRQIDGLDPSRLVEDESQLKPGENIDEKIKKNFFLLTEVSKKECFVGEPIMATFKAYSRLTANSQVVRRPSLSGFSVIEMVDAYNNQPDVEKYNGHYFNVHLIRKVQLFALQPGEFTLEPAEVESIIRFTRNEDRRNGIRLRDIFRRGHREFELQRQVSFKTPEETILVHPLPENEPEDFSGAVGSFSIEMSMEDTVAAQHEPTIVRLLIRGTGNFPLITDPLIKWPAGLQVSGPIVTEDVNKYEYPLSGVKIFQFTIDPADTGSYTIPPAKFSYFNPSLEAYQSAETLPLHFSVILSPGNKRKSQGEIITNKQTVPLHMYYFGIVAVVIVAVIIYLAFKPVKKDSS